VEVKSPGWSETTATNAPVQDEAVQAVLGWTKNTSSCLAQGFFSPFSAPKFSPPTYSPPFYLPPPSYLPHLI
jgi:hypothetical protein